MNREDAEKLSQEVINILKQKRLEKGISKLEISKQTGISRTAITLIENNKNSPTLRTLLIISSCINVDLADILQEVQNNKTNTGV